MNKYLPLPEPVKVGPVMVLGYSRLYDQPMVDAGRGPVIVDRLMRLHWDEGEDDFLTETQLNLINSIISPLRQQWGDATDGKAAQER